MPTNIVSIALHYRSSTLYQGSLTHSVPLYLNPQCDRTLGKAGQLRPPGGHGQEALVRGLRGAGGPDHAGRRPQLAPSPPDVCGSDRASFRELEWKTAVFCARAVRKTPSASYSSTVALSGSPCNPRAILRQSAVVWQRADPRGGALITQVRKTPSWPKSWANFCLL